LLVDTLGLYVHAASVQDWEEAKRELEPVLRRCRRLKGILADSAYGKKGLPEWVRPFGRKVLQTVLRPVCRKGFVALPKRWTVERTMGRLSHFRRLSKGHGH